MNNPRYYGIECIVSRGVLAFATCCIISVSKIINLPSRFLLILEPVAIPAVNIIIKIELIRYGRHSSTMREVVSIHAGQAGVQIGNGYWEL
jgi:hypothetical protein